MPNTDSSAASSVASYWYTKYIVFPASTDTEWVVPKTKKKRWMSSLFQSAVLLLHPVGNQQQFSGRRNQPPLVVGHDVDQTEQQLHSHEVPVGVHSDAVLGLDDGLDQHVGRESGEVGEPESLRAKSDGVEEGDIGGSLADEDEPPEGGANAQLVDGVRERANASGVGGRRRGGGGGGAE
ncbi:hypothetical protein BHM03_00055652 [Ensete ventricosum]|nr:hypothetical protein BHM03_00055652 [Ensete ventricosum]